MILSFSSSANGIAMAINVDQIVSIQLDSENDLFVESSTGEMHHCDSHTFTQLTETWEDKLRIARRTQ